MNVNTNADNPIANEWRDTYYPDSASHCSVAYALDHSILKWTGLQRDVIEKVGYYPIEITSRTCALCKWHSGNSCVTCPIKVVNGRSCDREWRMWIDQEDPAPMLALLKETKRKVEEDLRRKDIEMNEETKTPTLELSENHEYRTRGGHRAFYVNRRLNGSEPHLFIIEKVGGDEEDVPVAIGERLRYYRDGTDSSFDIVGYYANWPEIPVDTKILVRDHEANEWAPAYLARYDHQMVYAFREGRTSFSVECPTLEGMAKETAWSYAKLVE